MFGGKLRTWMEAHIVRARKKSQRPSGNKESQAGAAPDTACPSSAPTPAPPSNQRHVANCKHSCSSGSGGSNGGGSSLEAMLGASGASGSGGGNANGNNGGGGASLSSPESAYSTGYSTDGTSPGASFPPEYYINIRTGTHYFQQHQQQHQLQHQQHHQGVVRQQAPPPPPPSRPSHPPRPPLKQVDFLLDRCSSPILLKKDVPKRCLPQGHRRSESCDVVRSTLVKVAIPVAVEEPNSLAPVAPNLVLSASPSPRQRSRIRTNPWVPNTVVGTNSSGSSFGRANGIEEQSCNGSTCSSVANGCKSGSGSDSTTKKQQPREPKKGILVSCKENSPVVRSPVPSVTWSPRRVGMTVSSSSSGSRRSSDDDLTLHEMMGKYDESYVYERETDILSDSDPTDCEDCADTDADTGLDGGDEQDPEDLDFIDKDSFQDLNLSDTERGPRRLGHSSYYHLPNELSRKLSRHRENSARRAGNAARKAAKSRSGPRRRRPRDATASRSLGGTPISNRRKPLDNISEVRNNHSPVRLMHRTLFIEDSRIESVKRRSNSVSYVSRSCEVRQSIPGGNYLANFDSEIALIEADKEADKKYKELIMEAEHILVSMKATTPILGSPRRALNNPPANKRVELLRNAEIDVLPKPRGIDSIPGSPKYGSPRFSPKKNHITNFMQINSPELSRRESNINTNENIYSSPKKLLIHAPVVQKPVMLKPMEMNKITKTPNSPRMTRKNLCPSSPSRCLENRLESSNSIMNGHIKKSPPNCRPMTPQPSSPLLHIDDDSDDSTEKEQSNVNTKEQLDSIKFQESVKNIDLLNKNMLPLHVDSQSGDSSSLVGGTSSSSDGDGDQNKRIKDKRPPLLTFRSVDIGHRVSDSGYCPQSEPVKRKVYSCSATFDRLQKSLEPHHLIRQKSDGEASTTDERSTESSSQTNLKDKSSELHNGNYEEIHNLDGSDHSGQSQRQLTLLRRQMLLQTIEGLKRSLEDQSASLKKTYHESEAKHENIETY